MISLQNKIVQTFSKYDELCQIDIKHNHQKGLAMVELKPNNEYGQEVICVLIYEDNIILSYDYFEKCFSLSIESAEKTTDNIFSIIDKIFKEELIAVTTYSVNINVSKVSDLYEPSEAKKIRRKKNFRARSWFGTYDDECT